MRVVGGWIGFGQDVPLGAFDVSLPNRRLISSLAMRFYGRPDRRRGVFVDSGQSASLLERLHRHRHLSFGFEVFEKTPPILNQLTERIFRLRNRERRKRD